MKKLFSKSGHTFCFYLSSLLWANAYLVDIGYSDLQTLSSATMLDGIQLTGAGVAVSQIEASSGSNYAPNAGNSEFTGKTITQESGSSGASGHATSVGRAFYGNSTSIAPGISSIKSYEANGWLIGDYLNTGQVDNPLSDGSKIHNHSWIGSFQDSNASAQALLRMDYAIERDNVLSVVGVNNGSGDSVPALMASGFNSIAVGLSNGNHSSGTPALFGTNRVKPDIVAPGATSQATSFATPVVAAAAALLIEAAQSNTNTQDGGDAQNTEMLKALLMGGATKDDLPSWSNTSTQPLDTTFGAGELNIANSYEILAAGQQEASTVLDVETTG